MKANLRLALESWCSKDIPFEIRIWVAGMLRAQVEQLESMKDTTDEQLLSVRMQYAVLGIAQDFLCKALDDADAAIKDLTNLQNPTIEVQLVVQKNMEVFVIAFLADLSYTLKQRAERAKFVISQEAHAYLLHQADACARAAKLLSIATNVMLR
jgi:hypothetical protein